jgi:hypothetical protein
MVQTYQQHASGDFTVALVKDSNHCGLDYGNGFAHFRFQIDIEYRDGALDSQGFLLDNLAFQRYFNNLPPCDLSCEQLADQCRKDFLTMLGERARYVCSIAVRIYPFSDTYVASRLDLCVAS